MCKCSHTRTCGNTMHVPAPPTHSHSLKLSHHHLNPHTIRHANHPPMPKHINRHTCTGTHAPTCTHAPTPTSMHELRQLHPPTRTHTHMHTHTHAHTHISVHELWQRHTPTHARTHPHTHPPTHTHVHELRQRHLIIHPTTRSPLLLSRARTGAFFLSQMCTLALAGRGHRGGGGRSRSTQAKICQL